MSLYTPPYTITDTINNLVAEIVEQWAFIRFRQKSEINQRLRKNNRILSIRSSLRIENNSLTLEQVSDVINGKRVLGNPAEILEVKNAYSAYEALESYRPYQVKDFLRAHRLMMQSLVANAGNFRTEGVGVFCGKELIHAAPPPQLVPGHIENLFNWAKSSRAHPLIKSSVMHYEIEFIHPFMDGNGRMGRLWQTTVLADWNPLFAWVPVESMVLASQQAYYDALQDSGNEGDSTLFVEFMLKAILGAVCGEAEHQDKHQDKHQVTAQQQAILDALRDKPLSRKELFAAIGITYDFRAWQRHAAPLLEQGLIEMTIPDKPNSRSQKYRLIVKT